MPVVRENSVQTDFIGFLSLSAPSFRHEDLAYDRSRSVPQSGYLRMVPSVGMVQILALRQQLAVYKRRSKRPFLKNRDRLFWSSLSRLWRDWRSALIIVKLETVIRWRDRKFREFWRGKSQCRSGRPAIANEHIDFIRRISSDHPEYGEDRIALELEVKFGIQHASSTVRRYMVKRRRRPTDSQAWRSFLKNQAQGMSSYDFLCSTRLGFGSFTCSSSWRLPVERLFTCT